MEWIILAAVSWILFFLLVDWSTVKANIWCGLAAIVLQGLVDSTGITHGLYEIRNPVIVVWHSSAFFVFGPIIVVGILMAQYYPETRIMRILNIVALTALYTAQEILLLATENVVYKNWHLADSLFVNASAMIILNWFILVVLNKANGERK